MGQVRHGSAMTHARGQSSNTAIASFALAVEPGTRHQFQDGRQMAEAGNGRGHLKTGPKEPRSTVLTEAEEAMVVAFRRQTLLPLDDCLYALQPSLPHLIRSALHRCLQRHGISRLPDIEGDMPKRQRFKSYLIGFFHIDMAEVQTAEGKLYLFVAIDRTSKFAFARLVTRATGVADTYSSMNSSPSCLTASIQSLSTMASSLPICRRTVLVRLPDGVGIRSTTPAKAMASSTA